MMGNTQRKGEAILVVGALLALPVAALDYRSVAEPALLYDAPSQQGKPLYAIARGTPVEVVVALDTWVKVRDPKGDLTWIERRLLSEKRTVMVKADRAQVRAQLGYQGAQKLDILALVPLSRPFGSERRESGQGGGQGEDEVQAQLRQEG